jgi:plastocyanin
MGFGNPQSDKEPTSEHPQSVDGESSSVILAVADDDHESEAERIRRRLSDALRIPTTALGFLLILAIPLGLALFEFAHFGRFWAPIIALAVAIGVLLFAWFRSEGTIARLSLPGLWLVLGGVLTLTGVALAIAFDTFSSESEIHGPGGSVSIVADNIAFDQTAWTVVEGEIEFDYTNEEDLVHTLVIEGMEDRMELRVTDPGDVDSGTVALPAGTYTLFCTIRGHREQGMEGQLTVTAAPAESLPEG